MSLQSVIPPESPRRVLSGEVEETMSGQVAGSFFYFLGDFSMLRVRPALLNREGKVVSRNFFQNF